MEKFQKKNSLKNIEIQVITNPSQEEQIEVINMKENEIFSIVRNGLYDQYLKLITNIDIKKIITKINIQKFFLFFNFIFSSYLFIVVYILL